MKKAFDRFSHIATKATGSSAAFLLACFIIIVWAVTGPLFDFSDTWQLVINTGTTIITFLMVFLIQQSQNKDTVAIHLKLNELIAANKLASNRLVCIEDFTEAELEIARRYYLKLADLAKKDEELFSTHSLDEAHENNQMKRTEKKELMKEEKQVSQKANAKTGI